MQILKNAQHYYLGVYMYLLVLDVGIHSTDHYSHT